MAVRRAAIGDEAILRTLRLEAVTLDAYAFGSTYERELARTIDDWRRWMSPGVVFILEDEAGPRGLVAGAHDAADHAVILLMAMWVHPDVRGAGGADALVAAVIAWAPVRAGEHGAAAGRAGQPASAAVLRAMLRTSLFATALTALLSVGCDNHLRGYVAGEGGGLSGCAHPKTPNPSASEEANHRQMAQPDQQFVQQAVRENEREVELARLAESRTQDAAVKAFAAQLAQDHSRAVAELRAIAGREGIALDTTPAAEKARLDPKLNATSGAAFDRAFLEEMVEDHRKDIAEFERAQPTATGDVKRFVDETLPVMREHLRKAEELLREHSP